MIREDMYIEREDWLVHCFLATTREDASPVLSLLREMNIGAVQYMRASLHLKRALKNSGMTYSDIRRRESIMVVGETTSREEMINTFAHELRHLVDDIAEANGIPTSGERIAYLTGDIALTLAGRLLNVICECPRCSKRDTKER